MITNQTMGDCEQRPGQPCEYLALSFSPLSAPLRSRWRNNGVSADFLGDYVTTFLPSPTSGPESAGREQKEIRHAVTYIANEFLENAMKYHERQVDLPIGIRLELTPDQITVSATNSVNTDQAARYRSFIQSILLDRTDDMMIRQLEMDPENPDSNESGLGLITMISDYGARLGWHFEDDSARGNFMTVTTRAVLDLGTLSGAGA